MIDRQNGPGFRDMRGDEPRVYIAPHLGRDPGAPPVWIMPAKAIALGWTSTEITPGVDHPTITLFALQSSAAFCFVPSAEELDVLAKGLSDMADQMRAKASVEAAALIDRARGK